MIAPDLPPLTLERMALLDLLTGRYFRSCAESMFLCALEYERFPSISDLWLQKAAHAEWIAVRAERGEIAWGGRKNRCDYTVTAGDLDS